MNTIMVYFEQNYLEVAGIVSTLICVWLNIRQNIWGWPWAIVSSAIYGFIYFKAKLYSDMELQIVFIIISIYGWWRWWQGNINQDLPVAHIAKKAVPYLILIFVAFTAISGYLHQAHTDASFPYFDSSLTAISLIAQWLMARKYLENWLLWIIANIGYIYLYFSKSLNGTAILYLLLLGMAIKGYLDWRATLKTQNAQ